MEVSGQLHDPAALSPSKEPLVPTGVDSREVTDTVKKRKISYPFQETNPEPRLSIPLLVTLPNRPTSGAGGRINFGPQDSIPDPGFA
jgi:hypothetical protein